MKTAWSITAAQSEFRLSDPPTRTWYMYEWDCKICGHETLRKPVFLAGPTGVISAGTRCAAITLYGRDDAPTQNRVRKEFDGLAYKAEQEAKLIDERKERYGRALAEFEADMDGVPSPALQTARKTYHGQGGKTGTGLNFPEWMAQVAQTGSLTVVSAIEYRRGMEATAAFGDPAPSSPDEIELSTIQLPYEQRRANNPKGVANECLLCGRPMSASKIETAWWVRLFGYGDTVGAWDDPDGDDSDLGCFPVGSECAKRLPATHRGKFS